MLLDYNVQPLVLGKVVADGLGLTDGDLGPCPYQILTLMSGSKKARKLTK